MFLHTLRIKLQLTHDFQLCPSNQAEKILRHEDLQGAPILIYANKQVREIVQVIFCFLIFMFNF